MRKPSDIPWAQLGIEGFAIVVSILLAFSIDAWWDARKEREEEIRLLNALGAEMSDNASSAARFAERRSEQASSIQILIDTLTSVESGESVQLSNKHLGSAFVAGTYGAQRAVYDAMVQSGQLRLIENDGLREKLAGWPAILDDATENDLYVRDVWGPKVTEHLIRTVSAKEVLDYQSCETEDNRGRCASNESVVQSGTEVIGLLTMSYVYVFEAERELGLFLDYTNEISAMISDELESR